MSPQPDWTDGRDCSDNLHSDERLLLVHVYLICYHATLSQMKLLSI